jgi:hypothetical protein
MLYWKYREFHKESFDLELKLLETFARNYCFKTVKLLLLVWSPEAVGGI